VTGVAGQAATLLCVQRTCHYHAGCPDGFGAAFSVWRAWGEDGRYVPRGHGDAFDALAHEGELVVFADISLPNPLLRDLGEVAEQIVLLDHHWSARQLFEADPQLAVFLAGRGHRVHFDLEHSGAVLAWRHFHPQEPVPDLLRYVEDQDLWSWRLADSQAVNAAIAAYPRRFDAWDELASRPIAELAREGHSIVRANRMEALRIVQSAHPLSVEGKLVEAVNATTGRSAIGHELAERKAYGVPWSCVYRITGDRVHATLYSIGDVDVGSIAARLGGGGHRNAAGFSVSLPDWLRDFVSCPS
jgi:hypothetical protein